MKLKSGTGAMTTDKAEAFYCVITWKLLFSDSVHMICIGYFVLLQNKEGINILQLFTTSWCLISVEKRVTFQNMQVFHLYHCYERNEADFLFVYSTYSILNRFHQRSC